MTETTVTDSDLKLLLDQFNTLFDFKATSMECHVDVRPNGDICNWHLVLPKGERIEGSFPITTMPDCALAMATGMGLEVHPQRTAINELLYYTSTVASKNPAENSVAELAVRGWLWHIASDKFPKAEALHRFITAFHVKENIELVYRARSELKARKGFYVKP